MGEQATKNIRSIRLPLSHVCLIKIQGTQVRFHKMSPNDDFESSQMRNQANVSQPDKHESLQPKLKALLITGGLRASDVAQESGLGYATLFSPARTSRKLFSPASRFSMISSASSSGSGKLSRSVRLLSLSQNTSRLVLSRALSSS